MAAFNTQFEVKDLGVVNYILQMHVEWAKDVKSLSISQQRQIRALAEKYGLSDCKPVQTPMEKGLQLKPAASPDVALPFKSLIGALLWIARGSMPDIMYSVIYLSRFSASYDSQHFTAAKRILRYLVTTLEKKLTFAPSAT